MDKYSRYYGVIIFTVLVVVSFYFGFNSLSSAIRGVSNINSQVTQKEQELNLATEKKRTVEKKLRQMRNRATTVQKKVYAPADSDLGNDTLFFTLYNDLMEMIHSNSIKIKSMKYDYNPENDAFVKFSKETYFVCEVDMDLVSNYTNLGKFIQDLVQYPYYIRILNVDVEPYAKDKKILISNVGLRLYARTSPETELEEEN